MGFVEWLPLITGILMAVTGLIAAWDARKVRRGEKSHLDAAAAHLRAQADQIEATMRVNALAQEADLVTRIRELEANKEECAKRLDKLEDWYQTAIERERALRASLEAEMVEQQRKITKLEKENEELKRQLDALEKRVHDTGPLGNGGR